MLLACLLLSCAVLAALPALAVLGRRALARAPSDEPSDELIREHLLTRYVVTIHAGETFNGLLAQVDDRTLVLRDVAVLMADGKSTPVDGDVVLRRESVSYMQRPS